MQLYTLQQESRIFIVIFLYSLDTLCVIALTGTVAVAAAADAAHAAVDSSAIVRAGDDGWWWVSLWAAAQIINVKCRWQQEQKNKNEILRNAVVIKAVKSRIQRNPFRKQKIMSRINKKDLELGDFQRLTRRLLTAALKKKDGKIKTKKMWVKIYFLYV